MNPLPVASNLIQIGGSETNLTTNVSDLSDLSKPLSRHHINSGPLGTLTALPYEIGGKIFNFLPTITDKLYFLETCRTAPKWVSPTDRMRHDDDAQEKTLLHWAADKGYTHATQALLAGSAKNCIHLRDKEGWTP